MPLNYPMPATTAPVAATPAEQAEFDDINALSHFDMCRIWRGHSSGHPWFDSSKPFHIVFWQRLFGHFGGFTPEISKALSFPSET